ncbi:MAG TPA: winged helix DNA-binding domain-containing protein [Geothrix sp.]|nr:winged helix DNA-binding domain-containing protein [Geothrix sp.]
MKLSTVAVIRLHNQQITRRRFLNPADVVASMGAMQGQDHHGSKWAIGLRMLRGQDFVIDQAIADRTLVRTYLMRGKLHVATAKDSRWLLSLTAPRMIAASDRRERQLDLDEGVFARVRRIFSLALEGGRQLTRSELYALLEEARISSKGQRGHHILWRMAMEGLICFASPEGIQQTFALSDEWIPEGVRRSREQALADLALRYFSSRGPATLQDFLWWSGLTSAEATAALDMVKPKLVAANLGGQCFWMSTSTQIPPSGGEDVYLLPSFDEFLLGYQNRNATLESRYAAVLSPGGDGTFLPAVVIQGSVVGTWSRILRNGALEIRATTFRSLTSKESSLLREAAHRYGEFMRMEVDLLEEATLPPGDLARSATRLQVPWERSATEPRRPLEKLG